jgi:hypothetical protein
MNKCCIFTMQKNNMFTLYFFHMNQNIRVGWFKILPIFSLPVKECSAWTQIKAAWCSDEIFFLRNEVGEDRKWKMRRTDFKEYT